MPPRHVVVDGSNIATEGRTLPSLKQLNEAVLALRAENPDADITVVVDASFAHRIDPSELAEFEEAEANNELVSPPAGAIGRGDAFLLRIAGKIGATVLSNDSFQEFHGEHDWLFTEGRLIGGKPVPGVGWIFTPRTPVRGVKSRKAVKEAKGKAKTGATSSGEELGPAPVPTRPPPRGKAKAQAAAKTGAGTKTEPGAKAEAGAKGDAGGKSKPAPKTKAPKHKADKPDREVRRAIAEATESIEAPAGGRKRRRKKRTGLPAEPVNDPLAFITFIATHKLGSTVEGAVETFTSHGAFVRAGGARCYIPIAALGDPPPRAARDVLRRGERRTFVVQALDPQRRGIELALPEFARVAGAPTPETIEAELGHAGPEPPVRKAAATKAAATKAAATKKKAAATKKAASAPADKEAASAPAKQAPPAKKAPAATKKKAAATKGVTTKKKAAATKGVTTKKKAAATKKASSVPARQAASGPARRTAPANQAAPAKKAPAAATKKAASAPAKRKAATPANRKAATPANRKAATPAKKAAQPT
jgi:hypothetical protein